MKFSSYFQERGKLLLPSFGGLRIIMMPLVIGEMSSITGDLAVWTGTLNGLFMMAGAFSGQTGYLTIDEKIVNAGTTHRRAGLHVDGIYEGNSGAWGGGGGGTWGSAGNGMLTVSSVVGCRAWKQMFEGWPGNDGECDHLRDQCLQENQRDFGPGEVFWLDGLCVHESLPMMNTTERQFVRLSLPSSGPWFEGYTENPLGVMPSGPILPRRKWMAEA